MAACGGSGYRAPVEDRYARSKPAPLSNSVYRVRSGETLYSIAFRYGLDYRKVASANAIPAPYTIYVGQTLKLTETSLQAVAPVSASVTAIAAPAVKPPGTSARRKANPPSKTSTSPKPAPVVVPVAPAVPKSTAKPTAPRVVKAAKVKPAVKAAPNKPVSSWRWPSNGKVLRRYSSSVHKGIDIGGRLGDPVKAVAAGQVVYAGTGIVGLGELLIIKHNDVYLSAYGHNSRLLVSEGDNIKLGQRIAQKGSSGTDTVKLHFEIRKEGRPIDPLRLLPRR